MTDFDMSDAGSNPGRGNFDIGLFVNIYASPFSAFMSVCTISLGLSQEK
jgi:hypothetical protein